MFVRASLDYDNSGMKWKQHAFTLHFYLGLNTHNVVATSPAPDYGAHESIGLCSLQESGAKTNNYTARS
jgi:hypothetical protein